jgi:hypothetical protein
MEAAMIPIIEFQRRSMNGPVMKADDFDLEFAMKVRELVTEYEIEYNPEELVVDDKTADAVFQAGVELLAEIGLYHLDTERVIQYSREEIEILAAEAAKNPGEVTFGREDDVMTIKYRTSDDARPPILYAGMGGVADESWLGGIIQAYAEEPSIQGMGIVPGLSELGDIEPVAGTLSEIEVGFWEQRTMREALERAGRPHMNLGLLCTVSSVGGTMAMMGTGLRDEANTQIGIHIMPEQKVDWTRLVLSQYCQERGIVPWQSSMSMLGGLCRGAAEASVAMVANMLGQMSYAQGPTVSFFPNHLDGTWATSDTHWCFSAAARATERNVKLATGSAMVGDMRGGTGIIPFWQGAVISIVYVASGLGYAWILGRSPLEARVLHELMKGVSGMPGDEANELTRRLMVKVDDMLKTAEIGMPTFPMMYDVDTIKPLPDYETSIYNARDEMMAMGVPFEV